MQIDHPLRFDGRGRTAETSEDEHVRDLVEQVLFTAPGERVNRPTFGSDVLRLIFAPGGDALAAAAQFTIQGALQLWLGEVIQVERVEVESEDAQVRITVQYLLRRSQERRTEVFQRETPGT